jgi:hypothetical protein
MVDCVAHVHGHDPARCRAGLIPTPSIGVFFDIDALVRHLAAQALVTAIAREVKPQGHRKVAGASAKAEGEGGRPTDS